jgi:predicted RNase H-like HicB family nuclease
MGMQLKMVYWKGEQFWLGKLMDHPEIMSQGETVEELEENLRDAYREMLFEDVPPTFSVKDIAL